MQRLATGLMVYVTAASRLFFADAIDIYTGLDRPEDSVTAMLRLRMDALERFVRLEWWSFSRRSGRFSPMDFSP